MKKNLIKLTLVLLTLTLFMSCLEHCPVDEKVVPMETHKKIKMIREYQVDITDNDTTDSNINRIIFNKDGLVDSYYQITEIFKLSQKKEQNTITYYAMLHYDNYELKENNNIKLVYNEQGKFKQMIINTEYVENDTLDYHYDSNGNLIKAEFRRSKESSTLKYDNNNRLIERVDLGQIDNRSALETDIYRYEYDNKGRITKITAQIGKEAMKSVVSATYNDNIEKNHPVNKVGMRKDYYPTFLYASKHSVDLYLANIHGNIVYRLGYPLSFNQTLITGEEKEITIVQNGKTIKKKYDFKFDKEGVWTECIMTVYENGKEYKNKNIRFIEYYD